MNLLSSIISCTCTLYMTSVYFMQGYIHVHVMYSTVHLYILILLHTVVYTGLAARLGMDVDMSFIG